MPERVSKHFCILCGLLMAIDSLVVLAYLLCCTSNIVLTSWVLAGSKVVGSVFC